VWWGGGGGALRGGQGGDWGCKKRRGGFCTKGEGRILQSNISSEKIQIRVLSLDFFGKGEGGQERGATKAFFTETFKERQKRG